MGDMEASFVRDKIEALRPKLLDLTRKNPLLSTRFSPRSTSHIRAVDELPDILASKLSQGLRMRFCPLPSPDTDPADEQEGDFLRAHAVAKLTDEAYLSALGDLDQDAAEADEKALAIERALKDRVREALGLPPRQTDPHTFSFDQHARNYGIDPSYDLPEPQDGEDAGHHMDNDIQTLLLPETLENKLRGLMTKERTWLQETGIGVLFVAFGFLEWAEQSVEKASLAPLVLLPVGIARERTKDGPEFWVSSSGEPPEGNAVLAEMLRRLRSIVLPEFEGGSIEQYMKDVRAVSPEGMTWKIRRQVAFGVFPSARMAIYHDLDTEKTAHHQASVVQKLLNGPAPAGDALPYAPDHDTDAPDIETDVPFLVKDADCSQVSAVADVIRGDDLAVEGPPGSGKSQTIVNTIAAALAKGRRVLFVAEKTAALDVVRARLEEVGLGEFVLSLQAERASREAVIEALRKRLKMDPPAKTVEFERRAEDLRTTRDQLGSYLKLLGEPVGSTGLTIHGVLGHAMGSTERLRDAPSVFRDPPDMGLENLHAGERDVVLKKAEAISIAWGEVKGAKTYWRGIQTDRSDPIALNRILERSALAAQACEETARQRQQLEAYGLTATATRSELKALSHTLESMLQGLETCDRNCIIRLCTVEDMMPVQSFSHLCRDHTTRASELSAILTDPAEPSALERLGELQDLCSRLNLESIDPTALGSRLAALDADCATLGRHYADWIRFQGVAPDAAKAPLGSIQRAQRLIDEAGPNILSLRTSANADPASWSVIGDSLQRLSGLRRRKEEISKIIRLPQNASSDQILEYAAVLQGAGPLSFFSRKFRSARKFYRVLSRRRRYHRARAVRDLRLLGDLRTDLDRFHQNMRLRNALGPMFRGLDTNEQQANRLLEYYAGIDEQLAGGENLGLRQLLRAGDFDSLQSLPRFNGEIAADSIAALKERLQLVEARRDALREAMGQLRSLNALFRDPGAVHPSTLSDLQKSLTTLQQTTKRLNEDKTVAQLLHPIFDGVRTDPSTLEQHLGLSTLVREQGSLAQVIIPLIKENRLADCLTGLANVVESDQPALEALNAFDQMTGLLSVLDSSRDGIQDFAALAAHLRNAVGDIDGLRSHANLSVSRQGIEGQGVDWALDALLKEDKGLEDLRDLLEAAMDRQLVDRVYREHGDVLTSHRGTHLDDLRRRFADLDLRVSNLGRSKLRSHLFWNCAPPTGQSTGPKRNWTEKSLVDNEVNKQRNYISVRDLVMRSGRALQELKPVWMMSPLAVAQYLPAHAIKFDLCIIDEASQMRPEDAIGALARAGQAMVVGDTNQLPPSNQFQRTVDDDGLTTDEDDGIDPVDEESILELANRALRPVRRLRWHYRSRHSALIAFCNQEIYDNDLVLFPAPSEDREDRGVRLVPVEGGYRKGTNPTEAEVMVKAAILFMEQNPNRSLGIVTMNQKQRDLIIEALDQAIDASDAAAAYIRTWEERNGGLEPLFVKNLENVQGDERDVIFIGTVYGPERPGGPVLQRFGPINQKNGHRRLNVLFTRAKEQIVTFTSMKATDIRVDENSPRGVRMLRGWLEYSGSGNLSSSTATSRDPGSAFEIFVMERIKSMGYEPVPQVGASKFFIDIGVKAPHEWPYGFVLGVECDGARYHSARPARDRDRLRQQVLEGLGWTLHRIWSTDWFNDPDAETERLRRAIDDRIKALKEQQSRLPLVPDIAGIQQQDEAAADVPTSAYVQTGEVSGASQHDLLGYQAPEQGNLGFDEPANDHATDLIVDPDTQIAKVSPPKIDRIRIKVGDTVQLRYLDRDQGVFRFTLSNTENDPDQGIIGSGMPIALAVIDAEEGDQVEVPIGFRVRPAVIVWVSRPGTD